ncbi:hypothetical protein EIP86_003579 [Pleurotus ostreatoroseus]|nr:hypothetical protein EIP86_003579 [Pleurotus ostreatoroseus]
MADPASSSRSTHSISRLTSSDKLKKIPSDRQSTSDSVSVNPVPSSHESSTIDGNHRPTSPNEADLENSEDPVVEGYRKEAYGPSPGEKGWDEFEVRFTEGDSDDPHNWSRTRRWYITMVGALLVLNSTFASSSPTGIVESMEQYFTFNDEVATLTISLFVAGYCVGPLVWGPVSEQYGRKPPLVIAFIVYTAFQVGCALSHNTASIIIFRFLSGTFAAAPLVISAALMSDIWDPNTRGKALGVFVVAPFAGPSLGPIVSGFMDVAGVSWRWTYWVLTLFAGFCLALVVLTLPETYTPALLVKRAKKLRKTTGDQRWWAPLEQSKLSFGQRVESTIARPFKIFFLEPMLIAVTLYMSFVYGCIYLLFEAYPIVFTQGHHFNAGITGLMFLPIFTGSIFGVAAYLLIWNPRYVRLSREYAPAPVPPEQRLHQAMFAAPIFAVSFFWFGWTSYPSVNYWAPLLAGAPLGLSIVLIFLALLNYIVDAYLFAAASAVAANTVVRSLFGAGFPLFASQMYESLNPRWASTLLGFVALALAPIPFVLIKYGSTLRERSRFAPSDGEKPGAPRRKPSKESESV